MNETNHFSYDGNHNLRTTVDPLGFTNRFVYDASFNLVNAIDARGNTNCLGYNSDFLLTGSTNGAGDWVKFTYNGNGTLATRVDPGGTTSQRPWLCDFVPIQLAAATHQHHCSHQRGDSRGV